MQPGEYRTMQQAVRAIQDDGSLRRLSRVDEPPPICALQPVDSLWIGGAGHPLGTPLRRLLTAAPQSIPVSICTNRTGNDPSQSPEIHTFRLIHPDSSIWLISLTFLSCCNNGNLRRASCDSSENRRFRKIFYDTRFATQGRPNGDGGSRLPDRAGANSAREPGRSSPVRPIRHS